MPTILITGASGFIGRHFCHAMDEMNWSIVALSRDINKAKKVLPDTSRVISKLSDMDSDSYIDAVVNLAGESLAEGRWTEKRKEIFYSSRIGFTEQLFTFFNDGRPAPKVIISGSATGFYGPSSDILDESGQSVDGFSHRLCLDWENSALKFEDLGSRVCLIRTGIVLGELGALAKMLLPFQLGLGGPIGNGKQFMSWIHINDMIRLLKFCLLTLEIEGSVNATAPEPVTNKTFSQELATVLKRPALIPLPGMLVKLLFGEMGQELLLQGQRVIPKKMLDAGFEFKYPELKMALINLLKEQQKPH
jgi:hypothetical protein